MDAHEAALAHFGVKGMKWGVRKRDKTPRPVEVKTAPGRKVKAKGGHNQPAAEDAIEAAKLKQVARKSTTDSLSNKELQQLLTRMQLEESYDRLRKSDAQLSKGRKAAKRLLEGADGDEIVENVGNVAEKAGIPFGSKAAKGVSIGLGIAKMYAGIKGNQKKKKKK